MADGKFAIQVAVQQSVAKDFSRIEKQVTDMRNSILKLNTKLAKTNKELERIKKNTGLKSQAGQANFFASQMGTAIKKLIAYRTVFLTLRGLKDIFADTANDVIKIDAVLADLNKVMNTTEANLLKLRNAAFDFAKAFGKPINDVTAGFKIFAQQGLNTNQIIERTQALMLAISATTLTANQAVEALTAASRNFNLEGLQLVKVVDAWKSVESSAAVGAQDLANAMKQLAQVASVAGVSLDFLNGITAAVASVTRKSGQAIGTSYRTIFARLQSKEAIQSFQELGVNVLDARGELRGMEGLLKDLAPIWDTLTDGQKRNFALLAGGKRRYSDFLALMNNFSQAIESAETSQNAFGEATIAAQINAAKLEARLQTIKTAWQELRVVVGEEAVKAFVDASSALVPFLETLTKNKEVVKDMIKQLGFLVAGLAGLGIIVGVVKAFLALKVAVSAAFVGVSSLAAGFAALAPLLVALGAVAVTAVTIFNAYNKLNIVTETAIDRADKLTEALLDETEQTKKATKALEGKALALTKVNKAFQLNQTAIDGQRAIDILLEERAKKVTALEKGTKLGSVTTFTGGVPATETREIPLEKADIAKLNAEIKELDDKVLGVRVNMALFYDEMLKVAEGEQAAADAAKVALLNFEKLKNTLKILSEVDTLELSFQKAREEAERIGKPFDALKFRLNQLTGIQKQFGDEILSVRQKLAFISLALSTETNKQKLGEDKVRELEGKRLVLKGQLANLTEAELKFNKDNAREIERAVDALEKQKSILEALPLAQFERNTATRANIGALKSQQTLQQAILDTSLNQEKGLQDIQRTKIKLAEQEAQIKINNLDTEIDSLDVAKDQDKLNTLITKKILIEKKLAEEKLGIEKETTLELAKQKIERDAAIRGQISANLIALPDFLTDRIEAENLLEQERAQAEQRLADARAANDAAAIERAQADLDGIENRIRDLASIAGTVAEAFLKPFSDLFVERTMKEFVDTIYDLKDAGGTLGNIFSGKETSDKVSKAISDASDSGASKFNAAITAGAQAGALLLGQVLGGGGRGAGIGAGIGGAIGGALFGPAGGIGGALLGGLVGGLFDQDKKITGSIAQNLADAIDKNTLAIENNNRLLQLNREFINAPTRFEAPSTRGSAFGIGDINVTVIGGAGGGSSPTDVGNGVADVLEKRLASALRSTGSKSGNLARR